MPEGLLSSFVHTKKADMAVGAFTISSDRQQVISFTKPYRDLQMGIKTRVVLLSQQVNIWCSKKTCTIQQNDEKNNFVLCG